MKRSRIALVMGLSLCTTLAAAEPTLNVSGVAEIDAAVVDDKIAGTKSTDMVVSTVELAFDATINEQVGAHVLMLYEEDDTQPPEVDEAYVTLGLSDLYQLNVGQLYVPFGRFDSGMLSDPPTLDLGETRETALQLNGSVESGLYWSAYLFNGDSSKNADAAKGEDNALGMGVNIGFAAEERYDVGFGYVSNIADSDLLTDLGGDVDGFVGGINLYGALQLSSMRLYGEYVAAAGSFENGDLGGAVTNEEQPSALHLEVGFDLSEGMAVAIAYAMTDEAAFAGLPESSIGATLATELMPGAGLAVEYRIADDYGTSDGGSGESVSSLTVQLAVEF